MSTASADRGAAAASAAIGEAVRRLGEAGVAPEPLGVVVPARRVLGLFPRAERVRRTGAGWRLGVVVVTTGAELLVDAATNRSRRPERVGYTSRSAQARDALRHAAFRGGVPAGGAVHVGGRIVDLADSELLGDAASGPVGMRDGLPVVRWAPGASLAAAVPLADYLRERVDLRLHPPAGA